LTSVLKVVRTIFLIHPVGAVDLPEDVARGTAEPRDSVGAIRLFELNAAYLMVKHCKVQDDRAILAHVLHTLLPGPAGDDAKCLLLALKITRGLIEKLTGPERRSNETVKQQILDILKPRLENRMTRDLRSEADGEGLPPHERPEGQRGPNLDQPPRRAHAKWDAQALTAAL
jgi:hypothetical protein